MSKCYFCYGVDKCCAECAKKEKLKALATLANAINSPSPNGAKAPTETSKPKRKKLYGFYSKQSVDSGQGTAIYSRPDGSLVEVSTVGDSPVGDTFAWEDGQFVGEVVDWVKVGRASMSKTAYLKKEKH